ncbi:MAG: glucose-6-phosphate isomerase [Prevotella sp.]|jgi:glucose-6-phosphate isomerase|nr:glucose-6-phosphate isomerase [Prevotella sp.]
MNTSHIIFPPLIFSNDNLIGEKVEKATRRLKDLKGIFHDEEAFSSMPEDILAYEVSSFSPEKEGTPGGLCFGITYLYSGKVGDEYFITKGHFHAQVGRAEFYWGIKGEGILIMMDKSRKVWAERMFPGSLHYIPGGIAHRVANTGNQLLSFGACWPFDAGHNYEEIAVNGFGKRLLDRNGTPNLI